MRAERTSAGRRGRQDAHAALAGADPALRSNARVLSGGFFVYMFACMKHPPALARLRLAALAASSR